MAVFVALDAAPRIALAIERMHIALLLGGAALLPLLPPTSEHAVHLPAGWKTKHERPILSRVARKSPAESRFEHLVYLVLFAIAIDAAMVLMVLTVVADGGAFGIAKLRGRSSAGEGSF